MADYTDAPNPSYWQPSLLLRWPNVGQPCFVQKVEDIKFKVFFAGKHHKLDVESLLAGRLYLQSLRDTRQILQEKKIKNVKDMGDLPYKLKKNLIPISIDKVEGSVKSNWCWYSSKTVFPFAYWVTLKIHTGYLSCIRLPQLFNLIHDFPEVDWYNTNPHSVYLHIQDWHDFNFIHATDTHIAWRNDEIAGIVAQKKPAVKKRYVNFNENFRKFIAYANTLHRKGELDFIILTGDIVDFIYENNKNRTSYKKRPLDNFEFFREILISRGSKAGIIVGEELEVPIFTMLGNHDYRPNEYPLLAEFSYMGIKRSIEQFKGFGLTKDEAKIFEGGFYSVGKDEAASFVDYVEYAPITYSALLNPDADYCIKLGKHIIACLDSSHDEGVVKGLGDYLSPGESELDFIAGSPDCAGFSEKQIKLLEKEIKDTKGLVIIAFHAPMINIRDNEPHHLLRETERDKLTNIGKKGELLVDLTKHNLTDIKNGQIVSYLVKNKLTDKQKIKFLSYLVKQKLLHKQDSELLIYLVKNMLTVAQKNTLQQSLIANELKNVSKGGTVEVMVENYLNESQRVAKFFYVVNVLLTATQKIELLNYIVKNKLTSIQKQSLPAYMIENILTYKQNGELISYLKNNNLLDKHIKGKWSFKNTKHFKTGERDPYLGRGVTDHRFDEFLKVITTKIGKKKIAEFILTGHTHHSIEYIVRLEGNEFKYFHDYYIDNTLFGKPPKTIITSFPLGKVKLPDYADPLSKAKKDHKKWWNQHCPLFVQTTSLYPSPTKDTKQKKGGVLLVTIENDVITKIKRVYHSDMKSKKAKALPEPISAYFFLATAPP